MPLYVCLLSLSLYTSWTRPHLVRIQSGRDRPCASIVVGPVALTSYARGLQGGLLPVSMEVSAFQRIVNRLPFLINSSVRNGGLGGDHLCILLNYFGCIAKHPGQLPHRHVNINKVAMGRHPRPQRLIALHPRVARFEYVGNSICLILTSLGHRP